MVSTAHKKIQAKPTKGHKKFDTAFYSQAAAYVRLPVVCLTILVARKRVYIYSPIKMPNNRQTHHYIC